MGRRRIGRARLRSIYRQMRKRCCEPQDKGFGRYGGRGIQICDEWLTSFDMFADWALSSGYHDDLSIDRIDNDGNYEPDNCRWATALQQAQNTAKNVWVTIDGSRRTVWDWSQSPVSTVSWSAIYTRIRRGWDPVAAVLAPGGQSVAGWFFIGHRSGVWLLSEGKGRARSFETFETFESLMLRIAERVADRAPPEVIETHQRAKLPRP
jgi:hypothetical protein